MLLRVYAYTYFDASVLSCPLSLSLGNPEPKARPRLRVGCGFRRQFHDDYFFAHYYPVQFRAVSTSSANSLRGDLRCSFAVHFPEPAAFSEFVFVVAVAVAAIAAYSYSPPLIIVGYRDEDGFRDERLNACSKKY